MLPLNKMVPHFIQINTLYIHYLLNNKSIYVIHYNDNFQDQSVK